MSSSAKTLYEKLREEASQTAVATVSTTQVALRWILLGAATILLALFLPGLGGEAEQGVYDHTLLGTSWTLDNVVAEFSFPVTKSEALLRKQQDSAQAASPLVFHRRSVDEGTIASRVAEARQALAPDAQSWITRNAAKIIRICTSQLVATIRADSMVATTVMLLDDDGTATMVDRQTIVSEQAVRESLSKLAATAPVGIQDALRTALEGIPLPSLVLDATATLVERENSRKSVSTTQEIVHSGDVLVRKGQRVNQVVLARLAAYRNAQYLRANIRYSFFAVLGSLGHAVIIISIVALYLYFMRPTSFTSLGQLGSLLFLPVLGAFFGWLSVRLDAVLPLEYAIVVPALAMIISILYEAHTALVISVAMSFAVGAARGDDYGTVLVLFVGGLMGLYSARNIHSRTQIFTSIVAVFGGLVIAVLAIDLERGTPVQLMWPKLVMAGANAVISPLLTFGVILAFERVFNVATDLRLEEFNNLNHDLLRKLNERAPGTYQHTLAVARLSEAAAQAIGANVLLTRVGAYFHDIGKIEKSEYFVENQIDIENKHNKLAPRKSAAIIRQHVQDGIELAATYRLPGRITQFIPMHHGTILIKHFYASAVEQAEGSETVVDPSDFRYPGPKPNSKETAVVMLADAVEAVSRLIDTTQREQIEKAVDTIIVDRVADGQLSNTPLTMHDLSLIKESFVRNLLGSTHQRVTYKNITSTGA